MSPLSRFGGSFCLCAFLCVYIVHLAFMPLTTIFFGLFVYGVSQTKRLHENNMCAYMLVIDSLL